MASLLSRWGAVVRLLVTGGAGFIGSNLVRHLMERSHDVNVLDDFSTGYRKNLDGLPVNIIEGSILDPSSLDEGMDGVSAVVHLAARPSVPRSISNPLSSHHANATGTLEVLEAVRRNGNPHLILSSSSSVYGANPLMPKAESLVPMPMSPYAVSKLAAESYALAYQLCFGLDVLAFRFFNVYGPGQASGHAYAAVIPTFIAAALKAEPLPINGDGLQSRDFTYVGTVASVIVEAIESRICTDRPVNLAFGTTATLLDVVTELEQLLGRSLERRHGPDRPGDVRSSQADNASLVRLFGRITSCSLRTGLEATIDWTKLDLVRGPDPSLGRMV
jgi:UDP-glucose 4-epimerase